LNSLSLGPLALPVPPLLLIVTVWIGAWVTGHWARYRQQVPAAERPGEEVWHAAGWGLLWARLVHVGLNADLYLAQPLAIIDVRDGGWHALSGGAAGLLWLGWKAWRRPGWRTSLGVGVATAVLLWIGASGVLRSDATPARLPAVTVQREADGVLATLPAVAPGRLRVINLWASWCGPCRQEMPALAAVQATEADVQFLFVNQGESLHQVRAFLQQTRLSLSGVWLDLSAKLGPAVGVAGLPATLFVNADGQIVDLHFGLLTEPALRARLRALRSAQPFQ
jgi:thiol-disulfide isomerase/thioredoxin